MNNGLELCIMQNSSEIDFFGTKSIALYIGGEIIKEKIIQKGAVFETVALYSDKTTVKTYVNLIDNSLDIKTEEKGQHKTTSDFSSNAYNY
ncbi:MAG: hypothetical protein WC376_00355 [Candidatus Nanoarchaeia archaeon]|jgi:hypothetical protein